MQEGRRFYFVKARKIRGGEETVEKSQKKRGVKKQRGEKESNGKERGKYRSRKDEMI